MLHSGLPGRRKNDTAPAPELLVFMSVSSDPVPELSFFMDPAPDSVCFHKLIFSVVLVCLKLNGKLIIPSKQN